MEINKIEYIGEVCDCDIFSTFSMCHTGMNGGGICSKHKGVERISLITWVDKEHFEHPLKGYDLSPGKYKITIERIEDGRQAV